MTNVKALSAAIILSAAVATPVFAKEHGHALERYRGAYNQVSGPSRDSNAYAARRDIAVPSYRSSLDEGAMASGMAGH